MGLTMVTKEPHIFKFVEYCLVFTSPMQGPEQIHNYFVLRTDDGLKRLIDTDHDDRYRVRCVVKTLRASSATLYVIRALIGS